MSWSDLKAWDPSRMHTQYDELAVQFNRVGDQPMSSAVVETILRDGWKGPASENVYLTGKIAAETLNRSQLDAMRTAAWSSEFLVQKAKDAQMRVEVLAANKRFSIDPVTTELSSSYFRFLLSLLNIFKCRERFIRRKQDSLEIRKAIHEVLKVGVEAELSMDQALCEAAGIGYDPQEKRRKEWQPDPDYLYGRPEYGLQPSSEDVRQNFLGDCTVVATLAAMADSNPESIKRMISFEPFGGNFRVTFTDPDIIWGKSWFFEVTAEELRANIALGGGSRVDGLEGDLHAPFWPAIIETAYAKFSAPTDLSRLTEPDKALLESYQRILALSGAANPEIAEVLFRIARGNVMKTALIRLTGKPVKSYLDAKALKPRNIAKIQKALRRRRPVLFCATQGNTLSDGKPDYADPRNNDCIPNNHAMQLKEIYLDTATRHIRVKVRNPWGHNDYADGIGGAGTPAVFDIDLTVLQQNSGFYSIEVGQSKVGLRTILLTLFSKS